MRWPEVVEESRAAVAARDDGEKRGLRSQLAELERVQHNIVARLEASNRP
jgi:hypothetical protein